MNRLIECITLEHHYDLLAVAALLCIAGSTLTTLMARRVTVAKGMRKRFQSCLAALIGGTTIWSTHFVAMLAYQPGYPHGYDLGLTTLTLFVAIGGLLGTMVILSKTTEPMNYIGGGLGFGTTLTTMHYLGMSAYQLPGSLDWDPLVVFNSFVFGSVFGIAAFFRFLRPVTRVCWLGGAIFMMLAIFSMHFIGMTAFTIVLSPLVDVPEQALSDATLGVVISSVTVILFAIGFISLSIEQSAEIEARDQLNALANIDALTELPNRLALTRELALCQAQLAGDETLQVAILTIDLNRFKEVNDLHGHETGDAVLKTLVQRIKAQLLDCEFFARVGGDEFVAIKKDFRRPEEVRAFAMRLNAAFLEPVVLNEVFIPIDASIGVATTLEDGTDVEGLRQKSDLAMSRAKMEAEQTLCFFEEEMAENKRKRLGMIKDLRDAIVREEFELVYQLQNDVTSRAPSGFETLLRWNHPDLGRVSPGDFIPVAEETGMIREIGHWVLRTACLEAASWDIPFPIAVNVAPQQLVQPSFLEHLSDVLQESGLAADRLELEVTEASIIDDQEHTLRVMHEIKAMGIRIAMDDFGTGYSSLATLQAFPFDKIKIDRSFVKDVHLNDQRAAIVRATLLLGAALDIPVLAEGVEVESELSFLQEARCKFVQGFFFGKPMPLDQVRKLTQVDLPSQAKSA